jgi:murein DD-endopeptidase MepM/ murein hydrolase activator NlpD
MRHSVYRYNAETCRYERVRLNARDIVSYSCGILLTAIAMLAGLLTLHDFVFDSEKEKTLRKENSALAKNSILLANQLSTIESGLTSLYEEDRKLHQKFFGVEAIVPAGKNPGSKQKILLADADAFRAAVDAINKRSSILLQQSGESNSYFASSIDLKKDLLVKLETVPTLQPVAPWQPDKLISGYGMRINPFHKGMCEHSGVDISLPRGTEVISTGSGTVSLVKRSDLQAGYGNYIEIDHGQGFVTRYAHLEEIKVRTGQKVNKGITIATIGSSGGSIAPHLHYEIIFQGKNVDPVLYMMEGLTSKQHHDLKLISHNQNQSLD